MIDEDVIKVDPYPIAIYTELQQDVKENNRQQKEMCKELYCMWFPDDKESTTIAKLALHDINLTCDKIASKVNLNNMVNKKEEVSKAFEQINKKLEPFRIRFDDEYISLREEEIELKNRLMWAKKIADDKEKDQREFIKLQLKEERELQKKKEKAERKLSQLQYDYARRIQRNREKQETHELEKQIKDYEEKIRQLDFRISYGRAGYVYVVSCDDMKNGFYKIGVTRREVKERIRELAGAGHAFEMNIHGFVYCDDVFNVESKVHDYLTNSRVNKTRLKKEWFNTTLQEIAKAFKETCDIDIDLRKVTDEEYIHAHSIDRRI